MNRLVAAATAFAASTAFGSIVAIRGNVEGAPLGVRLPISVPKGVALGWGSGLSAPWPMPVIALIAASRAGGSESPVPARICAAVGASVIVGTIIEPVTWSYTSLLNHVVMIGNLLSGGALIAASRSKLVNSATWPLKFPILRVSTPAPPA
jgi:hypothetical protein